jgi:hypothetical protein
MIKETGNQRKINRSLREIIRSCQEMQECMEKGQFPEGEANMLSTVEELNECENKVYDIACFNFPT